MRSTLALTPHRIRQLWYAPLLALAMGLMMLRMLVMARLLDVHAFAEFSGGVLVSGTFCMLGCLGLQSLLQREWPVNLVRHQEVRGLVRAAQCNLVAVGCGLVGLLGAALGLSLAGMTPALLAVGILHGLSQQFFLVATVESRSRGEALRFAQQNLVRAVASLGLSAVVAWWTGSALAALGTDALITMALSCDFFQKSLRHARFGAMVIYPLALRQLRRVRWGSAFMLMAVMIVGFGLLNADRWVASSQLGVAGFARYSFAWIVLSIAQSAQALINASVYPLLARRFAGYGRHVAYGICLRVSLAFLVAGTLAAIPLGYLLELSIHRWYPQYVDAITLLPLFLGIAVLRVSDFWSSFLLITGFESRLLKINIAAGVFGVLAWVGLVRPWTGETLTLQQVSWLAALLTLSIYAAAAATAWRARRE